MTMPSSSNQTGIGKKGAGAMARQRSRNTTPLSSIPPPSASLPAIEEFDTEYLEVAAKLHLFRPITYDDLVDPTPSSTPIPDSRTLEAVIQRLKQFGELIEKRSKFSDFAVRAIGQARSHELQAASHSEPAGQKGTVTKKAKHNKRKADEQLPDGRLFLVFSSAPSLSCLVHVYFACLFFFRG